MFLVGSTALNFYTPTKINDLDVISLEEPLYYCDWSSLSHLNNMEICSNYAYKQVEIDYKLLILINPVGLYIMKRSHLHRPVNFARHITQFQLLKKLVPSLNDKDKEVLERRTQLTKKAYGDSHPSLKKSNDEFFDDYVNKYYVHDDLHRIIAYYDKPIYDMSQAYCEQDLWNKLSYEDKINCVREECYVIALERYIIPFHIKGERHLPAKFAFDKALERVCTTLTSGWFRDFAIDNWAEIRSNQIDFFTKFLNKESTLRKI